MRDVYEYQPLDSQHRDSFRYIRLYPGTVDDPIECELITTRLGGTTKDPTPSYEAISYVWGSSHRPNPITCNGKVLYITNNLKYTLHRVRLPDRPRSLWVDSICINQNDPSEKGHQVGCMGHIYSKATGVLIDLGPEATKVTSAALSFVNSMPKASRVPSLAFDVGGQDPRRKYLEILFRQPWFERVWVVQEAALARKATVLWGDSQCDWDQLLRAHSWLFRNIFLSSGGVPSSIDGPARLHTFFAGLEELNDDLPRDHSFVEVLSMARHLRATDERDRIFAFIDIASSFTGTGLPSLEPNYTIPFQDLYTTLAREEIQCKKHAGILRYVQHDTASLNSSQMPSWVPRWDIYLYPDIVMLISEAYDHGLHSASSSAPLLDGQLLRLPGFVIGKLAFITDIIQESTEPSQVLDIWRKVHEFHGVSGAPCPYPKVARPAAFLDTLSLYTSWKKTKLVRYLRDLEGRTAYLEQMRQISSSSTARKRAATTTHTNTNTNKGVAADSTLRKRADTVRYAEREMGGAAAADSPFKLHRHSLRFTANRKFVVTANGYYGTVPPLTESGDVCVFLPGAGVPFILRRTDISGHYKIIGEAYMIADRWGSSGRLSPESSAPPDGDDHSRWYWTNIGVKEEMLTIV